MATSYTLLEPSFTSSLTSAIPGGLSLESGSFIASTSFLYGAAIMVIIVTAGLRYGLAGIWRIEASERGVTKSNKEIKRVTIGLLGVLSLFLLISTVNRDLLRGDVKFENLGSGGGSVQTNTNTGGGTGTNTGTPTTPTTPITNGSGAENLRTLNAVGITINHNNIPCTETQMTQSAPSCTSLEGLPSSTVDMLVKLRGACPSCSITVTGGTEPGHSSHGIGKRPVDIGLHQTLFDFLNSKGTKSSSDRWLWGGYTFWNESAGATANTTGAHFHVY